MNREYVIVSNKHSLLNGCLLFWGHLTKDNETRSFSGYTNDINSCERYTLEEIDKEHYHFPLFREETMDRRDIIYNEEIIVTIPQLEKLGFKTMNVMYLP